MQHRKHGNEPNLFGIKSHITNSRSHMKIQEWRCKPIHFRISCLWNVFLFSFLFSSQFIFFCKVIQIPETSNIQSQIFLHLQSHLFCLNFLVTFGWMQSQSNCAKCTQFMPKNIYTDYSKKTVFISENAIHFLQNFLFYWAFIKHFLKSNWC